MLDLLLSRWSDKVGGENCQRYYKRASRLNTYGINSGLIVSFMKLCAVYVTVRHRPETSFLRLRSRKGDNTTIRMVCGFSHVYLCVCLCVFVWKLAVYTFVMCEVAIWWICWWFGVAYKICLLWLYTIYSITSKRNKVQGDVVSLWQKRVLSASLDYISSLPVLDIYHKCRGLGKISQMSQSDISVSVCASEVHSITSWMSLKARSGRYKQLVSWSL